MVNKKVCLRHNWIKTDRIVKHTGDTYVYTYQFFTCSKCKREKLVEIDKVLL